MAYGPFGFDGGLFDSVLFNTTGANLSENVGAIGESLSVSENVNKSLSENIGAISSILASTLSAFPSLTENLSITESITAHLFSEGGTYNTALSESVGLISESVYAHAVFATSLTANLGSITESLGAHINISYSVSESSISISNSLAALLYPRPLLLESLAITTVLALSVHLSVALNESAIYIGESLGLATQEADVSESLGPISNTLASLVHFHAPLSENIGAITNSITGIRNSPISLIESLVITEHITAAPFLENLTENLPITENVATIHGFAPALALSRYTTWGGQALTKLALSRYCTYIQLLPTLCMSRYSIGTVQTLALSRYATSNQITTFCKSRYNTYPAAVVGADPSNPTIAVSPYQVAITQNIAATDPDSGEYLDQMTFTILNPITGDTIDLSGIPYEFTIDFSESNPTTWTLSIMDPYGEYTPMSLWSSLAGIMNEQPFGPDGENPDAPNIYKGVLYPTITSPLVVKQLVVTATIGGHPWSFTGVGTAWTHTRDWQTKYFNFVWKGTDMSILLNLENQSMQTIRSNRRNSISKASAVLQQIFTQYHVEYDLSNFVLDDYTIPVMHRANGIPHDWCVQIISALLYEWKMVGGKTFTPYLPVPVPRGAAAYAFIPSTNTTLSGQNNAYTYDPASVTPGFIYDFSKMRVYSETADGSMMAMYNRVIAIRAAEANGTDAYTVNVFDFGDSYSQSFSPPLSFVSYIPTAQNNGFFSNFLYYKQGALIATREITSGSVNYGIQMSGGGVIIGADMVKFTWGVLPGGFVGIGAPGKIEFHGTAQMDPSTWSSGPSAGNPQYGVRQANGTWGVPVDQGPDQPAPELRVFSENLALINQYGLRPIEVPASPLIPNKPVLQVFANRMLYRLGRQAQKLSQKFPLNPFIESGTIIREIDESLGTTRNNEIAVPGSALTRDLVVVGGQHRFSNTPENRYTSLWGNQYVNYNGE